MGTVAVLGGGFYLFPAFLCPCWPHPPPADVRALAGSSPWTGYFAKLQTPLRRNQFLRESETIVYTGLITKRRHGARTSHLVPDIGPTRGLLGLLEHEARVDCTGTA